MNKILTLLTLLLIGCEYTTTKTVDLDNTLDRLINLAAKDGSGKDYFKMATSIKDIPQSPLNPLNDTIVYLGAKLYFEEMISINCDKSCATTCHKLDKAFYSGLQLPFNCDTPTLDQPMLKTLTSLNIAYNETGTCLWSGKAGNGVANWKIQWGENSPNRHGLTGEETQKLFAKDAHGWNLDGIEGNYFYTHWFDTSFPRFQADKRKTILTASLAMSAYERIQLANQSGLQLYLQGKKDALTIEQKKGAILFFGKANCVNCHTSPSLGNTGFYAIGMLDHPLDINGQLGRFDATKNIKDRFKFKVPQIYNLKDSPFYGHGSQMTSIREVVEYKNKGENAAEIENLDSRQSTPLNLTDSEVDALVDFLENGLYDNNMQRYHPDSLNPTPLIDPNKNQVASRSPKIQSVSNYKRLAKALSDDLEGAKVLIPNYSIKELRGIKPHLEGELLGLVNNEIDKKATKLDKP